MPIASRDSKFKIGLVQTKCSHDTEANLQRAIAGIRETLQAKAPKLFACKNSSAANISAAKRTLNSSIWLKPFPGLPPKPSARLPKSLGVSVVASLFEKRAHGLYHNTAAIIDADGSLAWHLSQNAHPR